jgi:hypothetical protein
VEAELAGLASSGAATLVGLMVSDAWAQARDRLAGFFGRGGDVVASAEELGLSQEELVAARAVGDEEAEADIQAAWRSRLRRALLADPGAADELRSLLEELAPAAGDGSVVVVRNSITGGVQHGPVIQGQNFSGLTFHASGAVRPETDPGSA